MLCDESKNVFQHIHDVLSSQATELLVFMINDTDRLQTDNVSNSIPLGYGHWHLKPEKSFISEKSHDNRFIISINFLNDFKNYF